MTIVCFRLDQIVAWVLIFVVLAKPVCTASTLPIKDGNCPSVLFESSGVHLNTTVPPGDFADGESTEDEGSVGLARRTFRPRVDLVRYRQAIEKGRELWKKLQQTLEKPPPKDVQKCDLSERWDIDTDIPVRVNKLQKEWNGLLPISAPNPSFYPAFLTAPKGEDFQPWQFGAQYSPEYGTVVAYYSEGKPFHGVESPDRWSDVTWAYWRYMCARKKAEPSSLRFVLREFVLNNDTRDILNVIFNQSKNLGPDGEPVDGLVVTLTPGEDAFLALLRTPNVVGAVYMLMNNVNGIGKKTIKQIIVRNDSAPYLVIEFEAYSGGDLPETEVE